MFRDHADSGKSFERLYQNFRLCILSHGAKSFKTTPDTTHGPRFQVPFYSNLPPLSVDLIPTAIPSLDMSSSLITTTHASGTGHHQTASREGQPIEEDAHPPLRGYRDPAFATTKLPRRRSRVPGAVLRATTFVARKRLPATEGSEVSGAYQDLSG
ncbi:hypothetical protein BU16DRAFT_543000 [Lophium mytilinum]|uniref:Uncharacterized protein n=1 Tax=Lophium mytilinum TaxID=390894 RepID=A0A6A6QGT3_9PEZI|nr:hypothetical protein BU16DRAFT_543000 [Lophium mytilinum]